MILQVSVCPSIFFVRIFCILVEEVSMIRIETSVCPYFAVFLSMDRVHCGTKPGHFETSNHSLSYELGSE